MTERIIDYIPVSKLGRGYAGRIIDQMKERDSVVYILRNNDPEAVMLSMSGYRELLKNQSGNLIRNKVEISEQLAGSLHQYADASKVHNENEYYQQVLMEKYGR